MQKKIELLEENPGIRVKVKGDAGIYPLWGIDWLNHKYLIYRASGYEKIDFNKVKILESELASLPKEQKVSDEDIEAYFKQWINPRIKTGDDQYEKWLNQYLSELIDSAIEGAKWYRDHASQHKVEMPGKGDIKYEFPFKPTGDEFLTGDIVVDA